LRFEGDYLSYVVGSPFSTKDQFNGAGIKPQYSGGWWHKFDHHSNLNGQANEQCDSHSLTWAHLPCSRALKVVEMKLRPYYRH